ncbi:MAG: dihydrofolate reductase [Planctomycetes bacterium]|nr:dihydrofolate reductase [Planctomycetota bacterium]
MRLSMIVAMDRGRLIGREGGLPWRLSADLRRFKQLTMGHHLIMGRATFESIGRVLPGRTTIVLSRSPDYRSAGVLIAPGLDQALRLCQGDSEVFVVGGGQIYAEAMSRVDRIYLTIVDAELAGDTWFPTLECARWQMVLDERHAADEKNEYPHTFRILDRILETV